MENETRDNVELVIACQDFFPHNNLTSSSRGGIDPYVKPSSGLVVLGGKTVQYGLLMAIVPVQLLIRKTLLLVSSSRPFLGNPFKGIISISKTWLKAYRRT